MRVNVSVTIYQPIMLILNQKLKMQNYYLLTSCAVLFYKILNVSQRVVSFCQRAGKTKQHILLTIIIGVVKYIIDNQQHLFSLRNLISNNYYHLILKL